MSIYKIVVAEISQLIYEVQADSREQALAKWEESAITEPTTEELLTMYVDGVYDPDGVFVPSIPDEAEDEQTAIV